MIEIVVAPAGRDADLLQAIESVRANGQQVVQLLGQDQLDSVPQASHKLVKIDTDWQVLAI